MFTYEEEEEEKIVVWNKMKIDQKLHFLTFEVKLCKLSKCSGSHIYLYIYKLTHNSDTV